MIILAFESSCDETAAAVLEMDEERGIRRVLSSLVASQVAIHALYGGVVPEIASRAHTEAISSLAEGALKEAGVTVDDLDCVAVTAHPGLIGALLVGVNFAKAFAYANHKPLVAVDHILGHVSAAYLNYPELKPPFFAMVTSGGHTSLLSFSDYTTVETVGRTRDDAVGECFDKVGRTMGLPYPGGAEMDRLAAIGNPKAIKFPSAAIRDGTLDFSFSGLKTAVINHLNTCRQKGVEISTSDVAASFTAAVTASITDRLHEAKDRYDFKKFVLAGGVSANSHLQKAVREFGRKRGVEIYIPDRSLSGDNAAMIGAQAYYEALAGNYADFALNPSATHRGSYLSK
jgi:N6-L-threonylcarbamoyladenine synthase